MLELQLRFSRLDRFRKLSSEFVTSSIECCFWAQNLWRDWLRRIPDLTGFEILGKRVGRSVPREAGWIDRSASISAPLFLQHTPCATVAGFDGIAWAHASATRKWAFIRRRSRGACTLCVYFPCFFSASPLHPAPPLSTPPLRHHGEG